MKSPTSLPQNPPCPHPNPNPSQSLPKCCQSPGATAPCLPAWKLRPHLRPRLSSVASRRVAAGAPELRGRNESGLGSRRISSFIWNDSSAWTGVRRRREDERSASCWACRSVRLRSGFKTGEPALPLLRPITPSLKSSGAHCGTGAQRQNCSMGRERGERIPRRPRRHRIYSKVTMQTCTVSSMRTSVSPNHTPPQQGWRY